MWTVWNQSTVNEKVYTVSLLSIALCMWLVVHWGDEEPGPHRDRWLVLIAYVMALSSTNHMMAFLAVPALAVYILWTDWRTAVQPWAILLGVTLVLAVTGSWTDIGFDSAKGIVLLLVVLGTVGYALWRAPGIRSSGSGSARSSWGSRSTTSICPCARRSSRPSTRVSPSAGQALQDVLNRVQYGKPSLLERQATFGGPARELLAVLRLAIRARLGCLRQCRHCAVHRHRARAASGASGGRTAARGSPLPRCSAC